MIKKVCLITLLSSACFVYSAADEVPHLERTVMYVGEHARTADFAFQERLRQSDLGLKKQMELEVGEVAAEPFFVNGWGQIIGALEALSAYKGVSEKCKRYTEERIASAVARGDESPNPFEKINVRGDTKPLMMFPHPGKYFPWKPVEIDGQIEVLNDCLRSSAELRFAFYKGKIYLMIDSKEGRNFFDELWSGDFAKQLKGQGYVVRKNCETPHITLVNSNVVEKLKNAFITKYGKKEGRQRLNDFMEQQMHILNAALAKQEEPFTFHELASTYSEDYSIFGEVVVARLKSPFITTCLKSLAQAAKEGIGFDMPVKDEGSYHSTIAGDPRIPLVRGESIRARFDALEGEHAEKMVAFLTQFIMSAKEQ